MPKQKEPKEPYERGERPERPRPQGRERKVHEEIIERRLEGGAPPTPEAYARALEQWHKLPGSVMRPPTDITLPGQESPKSGGTDEPSPSHGSGDSQKSRDEEPQS
jgi:hypothetical protein